MLLLNFFAGIVRDIVGSDNIWQIDEVNVSFPNFSLLGVFIEQIVLYILLICPFIICISLPNETKDTLNLSEGSFQHVLTFFAWSSYTTNAIILFEAFSTIVIILKKDRYIDRQTDR